MAEVIFIIIAIIMWSTYHKIFNVFYFSTKGCLTELVFIGFISLMVTGFICEFLGIKI